LAATFVALKKTAAREKGHAIAFGDAPDSMRTVVGDETLHRVATWMSFDEIRAETHPGSRNEILAVGGRISFLAASWPAAPGHEATPRSSSLIHSAVFQVTKVAAQPHTKLPHHPLAALYLFVYAPIRPQRGSGRVRCASAARREQMKSSLEIAQDAVLEPIEQIADRSGLEPDEIEPYGRFKGKVSLAAIDRLADVSDGKLVCVAGMTPTKAGEGKTTTAVGLTEGLGVIG
jgi:hypothetical protein